MIGALELGIIYAIVALGVYLTFRVLNFPDLTVDGSFTTGAAVAGALLILEVNPIVATLAAFFAGMIAGAITGLLHTYGGIDGLLAGILTMIGLWSINLRIMGFAIGSTGTGNLGIARTENLFTALRGDILGTWWSIPLLLLGALAVKLLIDWFLATDLGLAMRATGNNEQMIRAFGVDTYKTKILGLALSNGIVALGGALIAQYNGFADIRMGIGLILIGLASVILGQVLVGNRFVWLATVGVIVGAILYQLIIYAALSVGLDPNDMKLISAIIVITALLLPRLGIGRKMFRSRRGTKPTNYTQVAADDEVAATTTVKGA